MSRIRTGRIRTGRARTGRLRFAASLGILAFAGVSVTSAVVTDSTVAALAPVGGAFDVAFADAAGALVPEGTVYAVPPAELTGLVRTLDDTSGRPTARFPLRIVNDATGDLGARVSLAFRSTAPAGALDIYSALQVQVVDPADPANPLLDWTPTADNPVAAFDLTAAQRTRTVQVSLRLPARAEVDGRFFNAPVGIGVTMHGESL